MINPHGLVRQALCHMLEEAAFLEEAQICTDARDCAASAPLAWHTGQPPQKALEKALSGRPARVLGVPLVKEAYLRNGHACFLFREEAYEALMAHIIASAPAPGLPDPGRSEVDYAIARMVMLSRKGGKGCPADRRACQALWLAMAIPDGEGPRRAARRLRAARLLTGLMRGRPVPERLALAPALGQVADCAARLLAFTG